MGELAIAAIGVAAAIGGTATQAYGQNMASKASRKSEALRKQQMELQDTIKRRQEFRAFQQRVAAGKANAVGQGAELTDSAVQGSMAQQTGSLGEQIFANNESLRIGTGIFDANAQLAEAQSIAATGNAINEFGMMGLKNAGLGAKLFAEFTSGGSGGEWYGSTGKRGTTGYGDYTY